VIFDVGHGGGSFAWKIAVPAVKEGFLPDSISTDLHAGSMNAGMKDMLNVMDKFLAMGLALDEVVRRATWNAAGAIKQEGVAQASAVAAAAAVPSGARAQGRPVDPPANAATNVKKVHWEGGKRPEKTPLFSGAVSYGNMLFLAGIGAHFEGDIKAHTKHVLDEIQKRLEGAGSSM